VSTRIMSECWPLEMSPAQKSVLISLADNANDEGVCWPSIASIAKRTCLSERAVRNAVRQLEEMGYLVSHGRSGSSNYYTVTPASGAAPAVNAPRQEMPTTPAPRAGTPASGAGDPGTSCPQNRKRTIKEPSIEPSVETSGKKHSTFTVRQMLEHLPDLSTETATDYLAYRKRKRCDLNASVWKAQAVELVNASRELSKPVDELLSEVMSAGWQGIKSQWLVNRLTANDSQRGFSNGSRLPNAKFIPDNTDTSWAEGLADEIYVR
jgi:hypothetical protein